MSLKEELKRLDWNNSGNIDIEDARAFVEEKMDKHGLKVMAIAFAVGLVAGVLLSAVFG